MFPIRLFYVIHDNNIVRGRITGAYRTINYSFVSNNISAVYNQHIAQPLSNSGVQTMPDHNHYQYFKVNFFFENIKRLVDACRHGV